MTARLAHAMSFGLAIAALTMSASSSMAQPSVAPDPLPAHASSAAPRVPTHDDWCPRSKWCSVKGRCVLRGKVCVAARDLDCQRAEQCRELGRCSASGGVCLADSDPWCKQSRTCRVDGRCSADGGRCIQAPKVRQDPIPAPRAAPGPRRPPTTAPYHRPPAHAAARYPVPYWEWWTLHCQRDPLPNDCPEPEPDPPERSANRRSTAMMAAGIVMVGLGGFALWIDGLVAVGLSGSARGEEGLDKKQETGVTAVAIAGGGLLLLGIPFWVHGAGTPSHTEAGQGSLGALEPSWQPELRVGPTGGAATWRF